jgi:glycerol uptake facilitator-like aquaporin
MAPFDSDDIMILNARAYGIVTARDNKPRTAWRKYLIEFSAMFFMVVCGIGGSAEQYLTGAPAFTMHVTWGLAVAFAVYVSFTGSGGHLNPAVTLAMCVHGRFPWRHLPGLHSGLFSAIIVLL